MLVLPLRNPVVLAKELSSLDLIAGGRLLLGMASGWYKREFDAVGVPFNERDREKLPFTKSYIEAQAEPASAKPVEATAPRPNPATCPPERIPCLVGFRLGPSND